MLVPFLLTVMLSFFGHQAKRKIAFYPKTTRSQSRFFAVDNRMK